MSALEIQDTPLAGVKVVTRNCLEDDRGFLSRVFCAGELAAAGWQKSVKQINHTRTRHKGTVRGMHFQHSPFSEMKLVSCLGGEIWDVVVDIRSGSPTFLHWHAEILSESNRRSVLIPEGFAHGFQALTDDVDLIYLHTAGYHKDAEDGIHAQDAKLAIDWPLPIRRLSGRDQSFTKLDNEFSGVKV